MNRVTIDRNRCTRCGICVRRYQGYCINEADGKPEIDDSLCNQCQRCISICPQQAILMNGVAPLPLSGDHRLNWSDYVDFMRRRRSTKKFQDEPVPRELLEEIAASARYAPNQNKNIDLLVIDDHEIISRIDAAALKMVRRWYRIFFFSRMLIRFFSLFSGSLPAIKKKMEYDLFVRGRIVKDNTQALIFTLGNPRVPVTEASAQYLLSAMLWSAEVLGVGSTLMDSLKHAANMNKKLRKTLGIGRKEKILGVLSLGYTAERIVNIPQGFKIRTSWNRIS